MVAKVEGVWRWIKTVKGNIANNIRISLHGDKWLLELVGYHMVKYVNVKSLYCTPKTNIILYTNYIVKTNINEKHYSLSHTKFFN